MMKKKLHVLKRLSNLVRPLLFSALFVAGGATNIVFAQNWNQIMKTVASDREKDDEFGNSVSISGDYAIVGVRYEDHNVTGGDSLRDAGSVYILKNTAGSWTQVQKIVASDRAANDNFGSSVSISGDYAIVGAFAEDHNATGGDSLHNSGSAYIFKNTAGSWFQVQKIVASDRGANYHFGTSISISGDYAIVSAYGDGEDISGGNTLTYAGSSYIFKNYIPSVGILENSFGNGLLVYPNPSKGNFAIDLGSVYENIQISITDISGKLIESKTVVPSQVLNLSIVEPAGIYLISVQSGDKKALVRLVKE